MARPLKTGMDYFPHDTDASNDEKVELLRALYGNDGYVFYFIMLERIYRTAIGELNISEAETKQNEFVFDEEIISILSKKIAVSNEIFHKILQTSFKHNIFCKKTFLKKGVVTSSGIKKRMEPILKKRSNMLKKYNNIVKVSDAETKQKKDRNTAETDIEKERKEKESKEKKSKEINTKEFDKFWNLYNKKVDRKKCFTTWKNIKAVNKEKIFQTLPTYLNSTPDPQYRKNPLTYLRSETWNDEVVFKNNSNNLNKGIKKDGFNSEYYKQNDGSSPGDFENLR